ncbi:MAG: amidohydrolase family protein [Streptosporangiales bacterium]|nr:amidohydrolase family protein [Streptosporangiales bacterium]
MTQLETRQRPSSAAASESLEDVLIVDTDVHVHESPGELAPYADMPWRVALEHIKDNRESYLDIPSFSPGVSDGSYQAKWPTAHEGARMVWTQEQMRLELDQLNVDLGLLFPDHLLKLPVLTQVDYATAIARAYNRWLAEHWASQAKGLLGLIVVANHDPEDAAREIYRYADNPDFAGAYLPCAGLDILWGNRKYDPIYRAAQDTGTPLLLHSVTVTHPVFPFNNHAFDTELARHATSHTFSIMSNLVDLVTRGTFVRFPEVRFAVSEAGVSWMPWLMLRLNKEYMERRRDVPFLKHPPSHYLKQVYVCTQPIEEPENLQDLVTLIDLFDGEDRTMFASDWPHHDFDHPMKLDQVPLSEDARRKIFGENAMRYLGIDATGKKLR